jgi:hypothetical protein
LILAAFTTHVGINDESNLAVGHKPSRADLPACGEQVGMAPWEWGARVHTIGHGSQTHRLTVPLI